MSLTAHFNTIREITGHPLNRDRRLAAFIDYFRWNIGHRLLRGEYVLPLVDPARLIVSTRQNFATLLYTCGPWDFPEMMFMLQVLRPTDLFVDVGANVGAYSLLAGAVAGANTIAFEPVPGTHAELIRNIRLNNVQDRVEPRRICLGSDNGTVRMTADRGGLNHVATEHDSGELVDTEVMRLDDALGGKPCHFMKIDAEGYEFEILAGAGATLGNPELLGLIIELNDSGLRYGHTNQDVHEILAGFELHPYDYDARGRTLRRREAPNSNSLNTLYLRNPPAVMERLGDAPAITVRGVRI